MTAEIDKTKSSRYLVLHLLCWSVLIIIPMFFHSSGDDWLVVWNRYASGNNHPERGTGGHHSNAKGQPPLQ